MAPPSNEEIEKVVKKQYNVEQLKEMFGDYVRAEDLDMMCNFMLGAPITAEQVRAVINGSYEVKKTPSQGGYSLSVNFDLSEVAPHRLDGKLPHHVMEMVLDPATDQAKRRRILAKLIPDAHMDKILQLIENKKLDASTLDAVMNNHYKLDASAPLDSCLHISQKLDIDPLQIDEKQVQEIMNGGYTINQLSRLFKSKFSPLEIRAILDSGLTADQLKGVLLGKYEVTRSKIADGSGYIIELTYGKESYKDRLQAILDGKYPLEEVLKLFVGRLSPEELEAVLKMKLTVPDLHALITGDYVIQRVDNPDGSYSLHIVYNQGAGDVKEIEEIGDPKKGGADKTEAIKPTDDAHHKAAADKAHHKPEDDAHHKAAAADKAHHKPEDDAHHKAAAADKVHHKPEDDAHHKAAAADKAHQKPGDDAHHKAAAADKAKKKEDEPILPAGEVKRRMKEAEEAAKAAAESAVRESHEPVKKVKIPDLTNDREWKLEKGSKLKVPAIFASDVKPNFFKKNVKHLGDSEIKSFYETKEQKRK